MQQRNIKKNFMYNVAYQILSLITPLITAPYIARVIGVSGIGMYSYTQSVVVYFTLIASLGSGTHGQRGIAGARDNRENMTNFFWGVVLLRFLTTAISLAIYGTFLVFQSNEYKILYLLQSIDIAACAFDVSWFYQGLENFKKTVSRQIIIKLLGVISILLFVKSPTDLPIYVLCYSVPTFLGNLFLWPGIKKQLNKIHVKDIHPLENLRSEIELFVPYIGTLAFSYIDKTMLGFLSGSIENGYYEQALKFIAIGINVLNALSVVLVPRMAYLYKEADLNHFKNYIKKGIQAITLISGLIAAALFATGGNLIPWFYGEGYEQSIRLLQILSIILIPKGINNFVGSAILIPTFNQNKYSIQIWISTIFNIILNCFMIPKYGASGAAIASVLSELFMFCFSILLLYGYIKPIKIFKYIWKYAFASLIIGGLVYVVQIHIKASILNTLSLGVCCILGYVVTLLILHDHFFFDTIKRYLNKIFL